MPEHETDNPWIRADPSAACACGSHRMLKDCCLKYMVFLNLPYPIPDSLPEQGTILNSWMCSYGPLTQGAFIQKAGRYLYRLSRYLDKISDLYIDHPFPGEASDMPRACFAFESVKQNVLLSLMGGARCLAEGLFVQSGILFRAAVEDSIAIFDLVLSPGQMDNLLADKYDGRKALARAKKHVPHNVKIWYGDFSSNFTHMGPLHRGNLSPTPCFPNNFTIVIGIQSLARAIVSFHVALERVYLDVTPQPLLWMLVPGQSTPVFRSDSRVFQWTDMMWQDMKAEYPPGVTSPWVLTTNEEIRLR